MSSPAKAGQGIQYTGVVVIEWPQTRPLEESAALAGWRVQVLDALTGKPITTLAGKVEVHVPGDGIVTADLPLFTDPDGKPLLGGNTVYPAEGGGLRTGVFPFLVSEMRVARPEVPRSALEPKFVPAPDLPEPGLDPAEV